MGEKMMAVEGAGNLGVRKKKPIVKSKVENIILERNEKDTQVTEGRALSVWVLDRGKFTKKI